ncbi:MAG: hypothetical protein RR288_05500 [Oscillibacter sp.]
MRRKWMALLLAALLLCQLAAPAGAAETVYYTAINENVLELTDATMPFWSGGYLYVPSTVFRNLNLGRSLNQMKGKLTLYEMDDRNQYLLFDLNADTVIDRQNNGYYPGAVQRNGAFFLPVSVVARAFGFSYSNIQANHGYLVWVTDGSLGLSDLDFKNAATGQMEDRYNQYLKSRLPAADVQVTPPALPGIANSGKKVYLCMEATGTAAVEELLDTLSRFGSQAAFFFPPELLADSDDVLRRMVATGQAVGILADAGRTDLSVVEQVERGNDLLYGATLSKTRLVQVKNSTDKAQGELTAAGYRCLSPTLDRAQYGLQSITGAGKLLGRITAKKGPVSVWLGENVNAAGLHALLNAAREADDRCLAWTETA